MRQSIHRLPSAHLKLHCHCPLPTAHCPLLQSTHGSQWSSQVDSFLHHAGRLSGGAGDCPERRLDTAQRREVALLVFGIIFFLLIITGLVLNTTFLIREIRRNEQHDAFINAVTHELKTPLASIRLYLETLKKRELDENKRQEFYDVMLADSDRLLQTVEQVLRAGQSGQRRRKLNLRKVDVGEMVRECVDLTRVRHNLGADVGEFC